MKFKDIKLDEWVGNYIVIGEIENIGILLLELKPEDRKDEGRRNLISIDESENIIWVAQLPSIGHQFNWFMNFILEDGKLKGWFGGSVKVEVDVKTGHIISEEFVW
nr:hypothetical protein [uncultured Lacibacter sp.]